MQEKKITYETYSKLILDEVQIFKSHIFTLFNIAT